VAERIARGEHADLLPAQRADRRHCRIERRRPGVGDTGDPARGELQVPPAAENMFGCRDRAQRLRREPVEPVLADADDRQPAFFG
jgi:hypothetical protein